MKKELFLTGMAAYTLTFAIMVVSYAEDLCGLELSI
jgi:hypothetical protein